MVSLRQFTIIINEAETYQFLIFLIYLYLYLYLHL